MPKANTAATLAEEVIAGADLFLGLSSPGYADRRSALQKMAPRPIVFALANPARQKSCPMPCARWPPMPSSRLGAVISPIRSITSCVFPSFSAVRWMWGRD